MARPNYISNEDIKRWEKNLKEDKITSPYTRNNPILREVCYANIFLREKLEQLNCPEELILRINFTAGKMSFGRDPWGIAEFLLEKYEKNELVLEPDPNAESN